MESMRSMLGVLYKGRGLSRYMINLTPWRKKWNHHIPTSVPERRGDDRSAGR